MERTRLAPEWAQKSPIPCLSSGGDDNKENGKNEEDKDVKECKRRHDDGGITNDESEDYRIINKMKVDVMERTRLSPISARKSPIPCLSCGDNNNEENGKNEEDEDVKERKRRDDNDDINNDESDDYRIANKTKAEVMERTNLSPERARKSPNPFLSCVNDDDEKNEDVKECKRHDNNGDITNDESVEYFIFNKLREDLLKRTRLSPEWTQKSPTPCLGCGDDDIKENGKNQEEKDVQECKRHDDNGDITIDLNNDESEDHCIVNQPKEDVMERTRLSPERARKSPIPCLSRGNDDNEKSGKNEEDEDIKEWKLHDDNGDITIDLTNDDSEEEDEEWFEKDDKNVKGNCFKLKRYRKKQKFTITDRECTMIDDINNDAGIATPHDNDNKKVKTIKFNVGGKHYDVSRSLLESFPNTILAKEASNAWASNHGNQMVEPIFIESDGDRFRFVLDYMRRSRVRLPCSISKNELLDDFKYLGFEVDAQNIQFDIHIPESADHKSHWEERHTRIIEDWKVEENSIDKMRKYNNIIQEAIAARMRIIDKANEERDLKIKKANDERDRIVNLAESSSDEIIQIAQKTFTINSLVHSQIQLKRKYSNLACKCLNHYVNTKELEWQSMDLSEFDSYGPYVFHENISDFLKETLPNGDIVLMKRVANEFGLSHIYLYHDFDSENQFFFRVKYGILPNK